MNQTEIQTRVDALTKAMLAKGLAQPNACVWIESNGAPRAVLDWQDMKKPAGSYRTVSEFFREGTLDRMLAEAAAFVSALPSADEAKMQDFMSALGHVIDLGRQNGIEVEFVNPLVETMKRLSENALTDQREVA